MCVAAIVFARPGGWDHRSNYSRLAAGEREDVKGDMVRAMHGMFLPLCSVAHGTGEKRQPCLARLIGVEWRTYLSLGSTRVRCAGYRAISRLF